jgi:hypothetical protein
MNVQHHGRMTIFRLFPFFYPARTAVWSWQALGKILLPSTVSLLLCLDLLFEVKFQPNFPLRKVFGTTNPHKLTSVHEEEASMSKAMW